MGKKKERKKSRKTNHPMTEVLGGFRDPQTTDWKNAWVGMEPTFQSVKSIRLWHEYASKPGGEDKYFQDKYLVETQEKIARKILERYEKKAKDHPAYCLFAKAKREKDLDQWGVGRQCLKFQWSDDRLPPFEVRLSLDPETFEYSIKPVPLAWFYHDDFVRFLQEFCWEVPLQAGLRTSIAHGGGQFSVSVKNFLEGSLLADDIASRLNHPELSTFIMDYPNPDDRALRATTERFHATRHLIEAYWTGSFHPVATGEMSAGNAIFDQGWRPASHPPTGLMDPETGPIGNPRQIFQNNFAFGRSFRLLGQSIHPGYWQSAHPGETGYRPDQIMRYSEINLNRLQIAGECHVKSGKVLNAERVPEFDAPLDLSMLYDEASWENRGQMSRTSARDFTEALLLDIHFARWLQAHPHVKVIPSLLQDQILGEAQTTMRKHGAERRLDKLRREARKANLEASRGRVKSDWIEPDILLWEAWKALPIGEKVAIAREMVGGFISRVETAAAMDPRDDRHRDDPMEWHRHRILPLLWKILDLPEAGLKDKDPIKRELTAWKKDPEKYLARRPVFSLTTLKEPWSATY